MTKKPKDPDTFMLLNNGHGGAYILKLDQGSGLDVKQATPEETVRAMRIGVACLNTGKTDREIYQALEEITP